MMEIVQESTNHCKHLITQNSASISVMIKGQLDNRVSHVVSSVDETACPFACSLYFCYYPVFAFICERKAPY